MSDDDLGTVRWFGESWGAPICEPRARMPTPVGNECPQCKRAIGPHDQGVTLPYTAPGPWYTRLAWHRHCFLRSIGADVTREVLGESG